MKSFYIVSKVEDAHKFRELVKDLPILNFREENVLLQFKKIPFKFDCHEKDFEVVKRKISKYI